MGVNWNELEVENLQNEERLRRRIRKERFRVERLDRRSKNKEPRPEFLIRDSSGPVAVCEVKTVHTGGFDHEYGVHISTRDPAFFDSTMGGRAIPKHFGGLKSAFEEARVQYNGAVSEWPELASVPLLVGLFHDPCGIDLSLFPYLDHVWPEFVGVLTIEHHWEVMQAMDRMTLDEEAEVVFEGKHPPVPDVHRLRLNRNPWADMDVAEHFASVCIDEDSESQTWPLRDEFKWIMEPRRAEALARHAGEPESKDDPST